METGSAPVKKGEVGELPFGIIQESDILTTEDFDAVRDLAPELKETFLKSQVFRTRTEMEVSVLNDIKHPTPASKYWQSVREQNVMFEQLVLLSYEYRKNQVEIRILKRDMESETDDLKKELKQIEVERKEFISRQQEKTAKDRIRELREWSAIKEREAKHMTPNEMFGVDHHQLISYTKRWIKQAVVMGANSSQGERQNLLGQLHSGLKACKNNNLLERVFTGLDHGHPLVKELVAQYQVLLK